ncbi:MAG: leucine-rich repeat domain-containing protein, partial [Duncaniella sp.]|nr:leucine-rich repeat domain-containing protein [Duncaniella sp.]
MSLYILTDSTAAISYGWVSTAAAPTIPEKLDAFDVGHGPDGSISEMRHTYKIVQINSLSGATNVTIPSTIQTIAPRAFAGASVKTITFAEGDTPLELYPCCDYGQNIETVEINRSIKAVSYSDNISVGKKIIHFGKVGTVKIGADVASLEGNLFWDGMQTGLESFACEKVEFANWSNWYNNTKIDCIEANPYRSGAKITAGGFNITTAPFTDGMTEIPAYKNASLKFEGEIIFPSTIKKIGAYAFASQKDLYYVEFPVGLEEIGDHAFDGCEMLTFESFPASLSTIGVGAFANCASQKSMILPEKLNSLGFGAFYNMKALEQAVLFCDMDSVPGALCYGCKNLNTLYLPKGATVIGDNAFYGTVALEEVILPEGLETICDGAFGRTYSDATPSRLNKINFPASLRKIGKYAFDGQELQSVVLNEGLEEIGEGAFKTCDNLRELTIPSTLKAIPVDAFYGIGVSKLTIPDNITELGTGAFMSYYLGVVEVGNGVTAVPAQSLGSPSVLKLGSGVRTFDAKA